MVSTSRKKSKGKDRKAKKEEVERTRAHARWLSWATGEEKHVWTITTCQHGCGLIPNDLDHPISSFMDDFTTHW